jgi:hypothetical protein
MLRTVIAVVVGILCLSSTFAENSLLGTWEDKDKGLKIVFTENADQMVEAKIIKGSTTFNFDGYSLQESNGQATLNGQFTDGKGNNYPFSAEASNGKMTFRTGSAEYRLVKQGAAPSANNGPKNPLEDAGPAPKPDNPFDKPAQPEAGGAYKHKSGLWSLAAPGAGWNKEETPDGNTTKWTHANGALVFVTIMPDVPFASAQDFFDQALKPGFTQSGAQFVDQGPLDQPGAPSYIAMFNRTRNNVPEYASCVCSVVNGKGVIFQMCAPVATKDQIAGEMGTIFQSFKLYK